MIGYISCFVSFALCTFIYTNMVRREEPATLGKKSIIPAALGFIAPVFTFIFLLLIKMLILNIAGDSVVIRIPNLVLNSLAKAFLGAGFTEEFIKLLFALLAIAIVRPKNVYAYALMFIGVGFGFTALEEIIYGGDNDLLALARLPGFALHMVFGMIMGVQLGLAKHNRKHGTGGSAKHVLAALVLPVLWHTIYDAATVDNAGLEADIDIALVIALVIDVASIVLQFIMLSNFKKRSKELCQMEF